MEPAVVAPARLKVVAAVSDGCRRGNFWGWRRQRRSRWRQAAKEEAAAAERDAKEAAAEVGVETAARAEPRGGARGVPIDTSRSIHILDLPISPSPAAGFYLGRIQQCSPLFARRCPLPFSLAAAVASAPLLEAIDLQLPGA